LIKEKDFLGRKGLSERIKDKKILTKKFIIDERE